MRLTAVEIGYFENYEDAEVLEVDATVEADLGTADVTDLGAKLRDVLAWGAPARRPELRL